MKVIVLGRKGCLILKNKTIDTQFELSYNPHILNGMRIFIYEYCEYCELQEVSSLWQIHHTLPWLLLQL